MVLEAEPEVGGLAGSSGAFILVAALYLVLAALALGFYGWEWARANGALASIAFAVALMGTVASAWLVPKWVLGKREAVGVSALAMIAFPSGMQVAFAVHPGDWTAFPLVLRTLLALAMGTASVAMGISQHRKYRALERKLGLLRGAA